MKCEGPRCQKKVPSGKRKYCSTKCRRAAQYQRSKKTIQEVPGEKLRGQHYERFVEEFAPLIEKKEMTHKEVAEILEVNKSSVTRMYSAYKEDKIILGKEKEM